MKTALDIQKTFKAETLTSGSGNVYKCQVFIGGFLFCEGLGTSLEFAEDTAFYGAKITQKEKN